MNREIACLCLLIAGIKGVFVSLLLFFFLDYFFVLVESEASLNISVTQQLLLPSPASDRL